MSSVKKNIVVNYLGQAWVAIMGIAFLPLFIQYLGMEAYGLIGLFAVMQAWFTMLDMGMTPTLNREMARFTSGAHSIQSIRDLLRSLEVLSISIAMLIAISIWLTSDWLASDWLKAEKLEITVVAQSLSLMAVIVALRFVEGIYRGSLFGLQRQIWYNGASALLATIRQLGALAVLVWISPTIQAFFTWQAVISLLSVVVYAHGVHRTLPKSPRVAKFSTEAIANIWKFAGGMMSITFLAILLTQVDKVILSRLLTLETFGYYTLAGVLASMLYMIIVPIDNAIYPRMVELATNNNQAGLASLYHQSAQLVTVLTAPAVMLLSIFSADVVFVWSGNITLTNNIAPLLSLLVIGSFLNGLLHVPYQMQLAHGWTSLTIKINIVAVAILIPAIMWIVPRYGVLGAACIWIILNAGYVLVSIQFMHRKLMPKEKWSWYFSDILLPIFGAALPIMLAIMIHPTSYQHRELWFFFLLMAGIFSVIFSVIFAPALRNRLVLQVKTKLIG
jgi:O-antigen/teichoic acid export membrane protein